MSTLITGASGFTGVHLVKQLSDSKILLSRNISDNENKNSEIVNCDLLDKQKVNEMLKEKKPKRIYHLAGSFTNEHEADFRLNVTATKNILEAVKEFIPSTRVLLIGSAAEYGLITKDDCPVNERAALRPFNVYGLTKIYQKYMMDYYVNAFSLDVVMARPFNLYGKGCSPKLFIGKVYKEIDNIKKGVSKTISLGNLESERDYISIEEAVAHYIKIMESGVKGEVYNVGKGEPTKTNDILKIILKEENIDISVVEANKRAVQANDSDQIYADISKLKNLYND